jgi:hypothetical protein
MSSKGIFIPQKLKGLLRELTPRFFLPSEFPGRQPDDNIALLIDAACTLSLDMQERFALELKSAEVESLILYLPNARESERACIEQLLKTRSSSRILELFWAFFQYRYQDNNVVHTAQAIIASTPEDNNGRSSGIRNLRLFALGEGFNDLLNKLLTTGAPLKVFAAEEGLIPNSPLASKLFEQFFGKCGRDGFLLNEKRLLRILDSLPGKTGEIITVNYLRSLDRTEFLPGVNAYILNRWGEPYTSPDWADIPPELRQKFAEWISYRRLAEHFVKNKLKLRILNTVVPYMRRVQLGNNASFIAADFGGFYIVDDNELSSYSYYVETELFAKLCADPDMPGLEELKNSEKRIVAARDFMIEEAEDGFMQLDYENVGRLFIMDLLNIKLNVTPDLRPSKSIIRKKRLSQGGR